MFELQYLLTAAIFHIAFIALIFKYKPLQIPLYSNLSSASIYILKSIFVLAYLYIYTYVYQNPIEVDIYKYYNDGLAIYHYKNSDFYGYLRILFGFENTNDIIYLKLNTFHWYKSFEEFGINENRSIIRFHALFSLFTGGSYLAHAAITTFMSYLGILLLTKTWHPFINRHEKVWLLASFLLPSILFWNAGVLKEPFVILGLGILVYALFYPRKKIYIIPALLLLLLTKEYIFIAALPITIAALISSYTQSKPWLTYSTTLLLFLILCTIISEFTTFNIWNIIHKKQEAFINVSTLNNAKSQFDVTPIEPNLISILKYSPQAIFNTLLRPFPTEIKSPLYLLSFIENILIWILGIWALFKANWKLISSSSIFWFSSIFVVLLALMIGLTVDNSGSLVRYRMPYLPFLLAIFAYITSQKKKENDLV